MSEGFLAFKWIGWSAAGLLAIAAIAPDSTTAQWNALKSTMGSRPGLLKKKNTSGGTTTTTSGSTTTTTTTSVTEMSNIPSNFDITSELVNAPIPASSAAQLTGNFRFLCNAGQ